MQLRHNFKAPSFERQRLQLLPPGFNQVQPAGILGQEQDLNFRPGGQGQPHQATGMDRQIVFDEQPAVGWELDYDLLQQLEVTKTIPSGAGQDGGLPAGRLKSPMDPQLAASAIVGLKGDPLLAKLPFCTWISLEGQ